MKGLHENNDWPLHMMAGGDDMNRRTTTWLPTAVGLALAPFAVAHAQVATIYGVYDAEDGTGNLPTSVTGNPNNPNSYGSTSQYDTPSLFFVNPTGYRITNAQVVLSVGALENNGQTTLNNGLTQTVSLGTLGANGITQIAWGNQGPLFSYDYDDGHSGWIYVNGQPVNTLAGNSGSFGKDCTLNQSGPGLGNHPEWTQFCAPVGNFLVTFTGTLSGTGANNGKSVAAVFGEYDVNGVYTGWEGVDPNGWSENQLYDVHSGTVSGVLANIYIGDPGTVPTSPEGPPGPAGVPEPMSLSLLGLGLIGIARRRIRG